MEDDSPVIYGLELNVSNQLIGLPFALQTSFVNNFKGLSFLKKIWFCKELFEMKRFQIDVAGWWEYIKPLISLLCTTPT